MRSQLSSFYQHLVSAQCLSLQERTSARQKTFLSRLPFRTTQRKSPVPHSAIDDSTLTKGGGIRDSFRLEQASIDQGPSRGQKKNISSPSTSHKISYPLMSLIETEISLTKVQSIIFFLLNCDKINNNI